MNKESCWADKTPLETGLILILIVATPVLITLLLVYILLPTLCVNCSIACSKVCNLSSDSSQIVSPPPLPDDDSIKLENRMGVCPYNQQLEILKDVKFNIDYAFIASIIQDVYEDDSTRQRYLCAAAIVTYKWVVTGSICFESKKTANQKFRIFVRAGSNLWSNGGSVHEVKRILFANNNSLSATVAAIKLTNEFPRLLSISPILLSSEQSFGRSLDFIEMYDWKTNDSMLLPLKFRKKYVTLAKQQLTVLAESHCNLYNKNDELFCVTPVDEKMCSNYSYTSFPVTKANILLGINFGKICDHVNNITVHLIFDTTIVLPWLKNIIQS